MSLLCDLKETKKAATVLKKSQRKPQSLSKATSTISYSEDMSETAVALQDPPTRFHYCVLEDLQQTLQSQGIESTEI